MPIIYKDLSYKIQGCLMEIYNVLGPGFREETYKQALITEFTRQKIKIATEYPIKIFYKGELIDEYKLDMVIEDKIILELKAVAEMHPKFEAQLLSYLKAL